MFQLTSSHTFTSTTLDDQQFPTAQAAWRAAATDYARTDAGFGEAEQEAVVETLAALDASGSITLSTGETISVVRG